MSFQTKAENKSNEFCIATSEQFADEINFIRHYQTLIQTLVQISVWQIGIFRVS